MGPRLAISVVIVLVVTVVKARSPAEIPPNVMCRDDCLFGYKPGYTCQCRTLGDLLFKPCDLKKCAETARCVERDRRAVCVSTITSFPSFPISPIRVCSLPKVAGPCEAVMPRFYYNGAFNRCEEFTFGGCRGNGNNFMTMEECSFRCERRRSFY